MFNYWVVMTEMAAKFIGQSETYAIIENKLLVPKGKRRLHAALGSPLFIGSVLANFYHFMGSEVGHYFAYRAFTSWPLGTPLIILFAYIGSQFSIEIRNWELRNQIHSLKIHLPHFHSANIVAKKN